MIIAAAQLGDLAYIMSLERAAFGERGWSSDAWHAEITGDDRCVLTARDASDVVIGVATLSTSGDFADLLRVIVAAPHRGKGVARRLLTAGMQWAQATGASRLLLEVEDDNRAALATYERLGFETIDRRLGYYGTDRHALVMAVDLDAQPDTAATVIKPDTDQGVL